jgi:uncharacterized protein YkwD
MKSILFALSLVLIVFLSACGTPAASTNAAPPPSTVPTTGPTTAAPPPTAAPTSAAPQSPTSTAAPTSAPTAAAPGESCTDKASFVSDVTVPDYSHFDPRETFTKTWRVKNAGTCTWTPEYKAEYSHGDALATGGTAAIPLTATAPGAMVEISVDMAAPGGDGKYETFYQLVNAKGDPIPVDDGASIWVLITVGKLVAAAPTTAPTPVPSNGAGLATASCVPQGNADFLNQMVSLINAARTGNGLSALTLNQQLSTAAQSHSEDMACNNFLRHNGWNGSTPQSRVAATGYVATAVRENIYAQPPQYGGDAQAAVSWWLGDPIHRDTIMDPSMKEIGVGYAAYTRSDLGGYFTVDFAAP